MSPSRVPTALRLWGVRLLVWLVVALLVGVQVARAAGVSVQARLSESEITLGESVTLELRIHGLRATELPDFSHPALDVSKAGGQSFSNSSYSVINGQVRQSEEIGYVGRYLLQPRTAGSIDIPPLTVAHEGQTYRSNAVTLRVQRPPEQDYVVVEVRTDKPAYVLGESVTVTLDISIRKLLSNGSLLDVDPFFRDPPPHLQIPWFEGLHDWKTTDIKTFAQPLLGQQRPGFAVNDYRRESVFQENALTFTLPSRTTRRTTPSGSVEYVTYQLQKQFRPVRTGAQAIPPVTFKATLPTQIDGRGRAIRTEKIVTSSAPLMVDIRPVPTAGQPASFGGAVGRFQLDVDANPKVLRVGDPLSVTLTLSGEGLLDTVHPPALEQQGQVTQDFKVQTEPPAVKTAEHSKTFTYTLRPRQAGIQALPSVEVAYYDPEARRFQVLRSPPVPLRVEAAATLALSDIVEAPGEGPKSVLGQELREGILANYSGEEVLIPQDVHLQPGFTSLGLLALPPLAYGLLLLWQWRHGQSQHLAQRQRVRRAGRRALAALRALQAQPALDERAICDGVRQVLVRYVADKLHMASAGLTADDVVRHLQGRALAPDLIEQTAAILHVCESVRYAPGALAVAQLAHLPEDTAALVRRLEASGQV